LLCFSALGKGNVENIYHVCGDSLRYKLIDTICLIESPQADEDDVWVPVSRYTQVVLGIQTNTHTSSSSA
jgi:hypothetical protein